MNVNTRQIKSHLDEDLDSRDIWYLAFRSIDAPRTQPETIDGIAIE